MCSSRLGPRATGSTSFTLISFLTVSPTIKLLSVEILPKWSINCNFILIYSFLCFPPYLLLSYFKTLCYFQKFVHWKVGCPKYMNSRMDSISSCWIPLRCIIEWFWDKLQIMFWKTGLVALSTTLWAMRSFWSSQTNVTSVRSLFLIIPCIISLKWLE